MKRVLTHFSHKSRGDKIIPTIRTELFQSICNQYIVGNMQKVYNKSYKVYVDKLAALALQSKSPHFLKSKSIRELEVICDVAHPDSQFGTFLGGAVFSIRQAWYRF